MPPRPVLPPRPRVTPAEPTVSAPAPAPPEIEAIAQTPVTQPSPPAAPAPTTEAGAGHGDVLPADGAAGRHEPPPAMQPARPAPLRLPMGRPAMGRPATQASGPPDTRLAPGGDDGGLERAATAPQLRRFIKSRAYVPMHELRRRFAINGADDEVTPVDLERHRVFVGLPEREGRLLGELLRGGDIGYELSLDPISPIVVGVYPMRPVTRA